MEKIPKTSVANAKTQRASTSTRVSVPNTSTGSPDSVTIAKYVRGFKYEPTRKQEVLARYDSIIKTR